MFRARLPYYVFYFFIGLVSGLIASNGWSEDADRFLIRITAKISLVLFLLAFSASSLHKIWPSSITSNILKHRRQLGISFAVSHTFHLLFVLLLQFYFHAENFEERGTFIVSGGAVAYLFMYAMAFTSRDEIVRKMGFKNWKLLHTIGGYYILMVFCTSYFPRALNSIQYIPFGALLVIAILIKSYGLLLRSKR